MTVELAALAELEPALADEGFLRRRRRRRPRLHRLRRLRRASPDRDAGAAGTVCTPAVAYSIEPAQGAMPSPGPYSVGSWQASWSEGEYAESVDAVRAAIAEGDVYQVNLVQHRAPTSTAIPSVSRRRLRRSGRSSRGRSQATAGRSSPRRRSCCSRGAARTSAPRRSRARVPRRAGRVGEGRGGARDDRRPRTKRSGTCAEPAASAGPSSSSSASSPASASRRDGRGGAARRRHADRAARRLCSRAAP